MGARKQKSMKREGGRRRDSMKSIDGFCEGGCGGGGFGEEKFSGSGSGYFRVSRVECWDEWWIVRELNDDYSGGCIGKRGGSGC